MRNPDIEYDESVIRAGDVLVALDEVEVGYLTQWRAPFTGGGTGIIPAGTRLVAVPPIRDATGFAARAEASEEIEELLLPETRTEPGYDGYYFVLAFDDIGTKFEVERDGKRLTETGVR